MADAEDAERLLVEKETWTALRSLDPGHSEFRERIDEAVDSEWLASLYTSENIDKNEADAITSGLTGTTADEFTVGRLADGPVEEKTSVLYAAERLAAADDFDGLESVGGPEVVELLYGIGRRGDEEDVVETLDDLAERDSWTIDSNHWSVGLSDITHKRTKSGRHRGRGDGRIEASEALDLLDAADQNGEEFDARRLGEVAGRKTALRALIKSSTGDGAPLDEPRGRHVLQIDEGGGYDDPLSDELEADRELDDGELTVGGGGLTVDGVEIDDWELTVGLTKNVSSGDALAIIGAVRKGKLAALSDDHIEEAVDLNSGGFVDGKTKANRVAARLRARESPLVEEETIDTLRAISDESSDDEEFEAMASDAIETPWLETLVTDERIDRMDAIAMAKQMEGMAVDEFDIGCLGEAPLESSVSALYGAAALSSDDDFLGSNEVDGEAVIKLLYGLDRRPEEGAIQETLDELEQEEAAWTVGSEDWSVGFADISRGEKRIDRTEALTLYDAADQNDEEFDAGRLMAPNIGAKTALGALGQASTGDGAPLDEPRGRHVLQIYARTSTPMQQNVDDGSVTIGEDGLAGRPNGYTVDDWELDVGKTDGVGPTQALSVIEGIRSGAVTELTRENIGRQVDFRSGVADACGTASRVAARLPGRRTELDGLPDRSRRSTERGSDGAETAEDEEQRDGGIDL